MAVATQAPCILYWGHIFFVPDHLWSGKVIFWVGGLLIKDWNGHKTCTYEVILTRAAHFSRFGFLARCEKKWPISREKFPKNWPIFWRIWLEFRQNLVNFSRNFSRRISREKCLAKPFLVLARNARNVPV